MAPKQAKKNTSSAKKTESSTPSSTTPTPSSTPSQPHASSTLATLSSSSSSSTSTPIPAKHSGDSKSEVKVPNVQSKLSEKEQARLQAQIGNLQKVGALFFTNENNETKVITTPTRETDLKKIPSVYFKNCQGGTYTISQRVNKILIEGCKNTTINLDCDILTRTVELWKCEDFTLNVSCQVKTLQVDLADRLRFNYSNKEHFGSIVWASIDDVDIKFADDPSCNVLTGFKQMIEEFDDSRKEIDQFIIRFIEGELKQERCVRLANGFLSTEREATEWEKRNAIKKENYVQDFLKESGLTLNKSEKKKVPPNDPCPCGSGAKYKKCCMNKVELTGLAPPTTASSSSSAPATSSSSSSSSSSSTPSSGLASIPTPSVVYSMTSTPGAGPQAKKESQPTSAPAPASTSSTPSSDAPAKAAAKQKKKK